MIKVAQEILLTAGQEELLFKLADKDRELNSLGKDRGIRVSNTFDGFILRIGRETIPHDPGDWVELQNKKLVIFAFKNLLSGDTTYAVSAEGIAYAQSIRLKRGLGPSIAERKVLWLTDETRQRYPDCIKLLEDAASLFWSDNRDSNLSTIGHKCREALQEFSSALYQEICPNNEALPKEKTRSKLRAVIEKIKPEIGDSNHDLTDALLSLWNAVDNLAQKVEHTNQLSAGDVERLLLYSHLIMAELDQLVHTL